MQTGEVGLQGPIVTPSPRRAGGEGGDREGGGARNARSIRVRVEGGGPFEEAIGRALVAAPADS